MSDVNEGLRKALKRLNMTMTDAEFKTLVGRLADAVFAWKLEEDDKFPTRAHVIRSFQMILMDTVNLTKVVPKPLPVDDEEIKKRARKVLDALLVKPVLAVAVFDFLNSKTIVGPWTRSNQDPDHWFRIGIRGRGLQEMLGHVWFESRQMTNTGDIVEKWKLEIRLPDIPESVGVGEERSLGLAKSHVDLALESDGILLMDRAPIEWPWR